MLIKYHDCSFVLTEHDHDSRQTETVISHQCRRPTRIRSHRCVRLIYNANNALAWSLNNVVIQHSK